MPGGRLPDEGELSVGSVRLPEGCHTYGNGVAPDGSRRSVAWVTITPVRNPGLVWDRLTVECSRLGLVPFIARAHPGVSHRPWRDKTQWTPSEFIDPPGDLATIERIDAGAVLRARWIERAEWSLREESGESEPDWHRRLIAPYGHDFPGLVPAIAEPLDRADRIVALGGQPPARARIGVTVADRPADALAVMGWYPANWVDGLEDVSAVLRSWEDRFGARLLAVGSGEFIVIAERPPRDLDVARRIAAEIKALAPDEVSTAFNVDAMRNLGDIADAITRSPIWRFWWD